MTQQPLTILMRGGLDLISPPMTVAPGRVVAGANYIPDEGGYARIGGIERFDGRPKPHKAEVFEIAFEQGSLQPEPGQAIAGVSSGATARILTAPRLETGSYADGTAAGKFYVYDPMGTFQFGETIEVREKSLVQANAFQTNAFQAASVPGTARAAGVVSPLWGVSPAQAEQWRRTGMALRRAAITAVPGSGPVRGVWALEGDVYAFRDNVAGTAGGMWKATAEGWAPVALYHLLRFDTGSAEFVFGQTLTGGVSGATAIVRKVILETGGWGAGNATGYLVVTILSGTFQASEAITTATGAAEATGAQTAITLPPGGRYDFTNANFYGAASLTRMYGVNGQGRAFEFDGSTLTPIFTGLSDALDKPTHVAVYKNHLFLSFPGGSVQFSGVGEPLDFSTAAGAGEIGFGADVTGMLGAAATALVVFGRSKIEYIVGADAQTFEMQPLTDDAGALEWTAQMVGSPTYMDDAGVRQMSTTQAFGNWRVGTLTRLIEPLFREKRAAGVTPIAAMRIRARDQYWLFFSDRTGVVVYLGRESPEVMPITIPFDLSCAVSVDDADGYEMLLGGTATGFVVEFNAGPSFDGAAIRAHLRTGFLAAGNVAQNKRFHRVSVAASSGFGTLLGIAGTFDYGSPEEPPLEVERVPIDAMGEAIAYLDGFGRSVALTLDTEGEHDEPQTLGALTLNFTPRGVKR
jgi:hypothetical protein